MNTEEIIAFLKEFGLAPHEVGDDVSMPPEEWEKLISWIRIWAAVENQGDRRGRSTVRPRS